MVGGIVFNQVHISNVTKLTKISLMILHTHGMMVVLYIAACSKNNIIRPKNQLAKIRNYSLNTSHSVHNLGFIFDEHLTSSDHMTSLSKPCYYHVRQLCCIRPYLDSSTACSIATSIVHCKVDHRLRGSASPVLTATGFVNRKRQFSTPYRIDSPQAISKKLSQVITSATPTAVLN